MDANTPLPRKDNLYTKIQLSIGGGDPELLKKCPEPESQKHDIVYSALLAEAVWVYQTGVLTLVASTTMGGGHFRLIYFLVSAFLATFVLLCTSHILRSSHLIRGVAGLKRVGLDISGGVGARVSLMILLFIRFMSALGMATIAAIFLVLVLFGIDINAVLDAGFGAQNVASISLAQKQVDTSIEQADAAVKKESAHVDNLNEQTARMRQSLIDPAAANGGVIAAQKDVDDLANAKSQRDAELSTAEAFAANELAGIKGTPENSGRRGSGPVRAAAEERVRNARSADDAAARALAEARTRLDTARQQALNTVSGSQAPEVQAQLSALEDDLKTANQDLASLRGRLDDLTANRSKAIQDAITANPASVPRDGGVIGQLQALERLAKDPKIAATMIVIDLTAFSFEVLAVLGAVFGLSAPTYSMLLAQEWYETATRIADEIVKNTTRDDDDPNSASPISPLPPGPPNGDGDEHSPFNGLLGGDGFTKRPRGRPPKQPPEA